MKVRKHDDGFDLGYKLATKTPLDKDKLYMVPRDEAVSLAHLTLFQLQTKTPEEIVMGASLLFATVCETCGLDPEDMFNMGKRVLYSPDDGDRPTNNSLQSLKDFMGGRVLGREVTVG